MAKGLNHHRCYGFWAVVHVITPCPGWPAPGPAVVSADPFHVGTARIMPIVPPRGLSCGYCKIILNYQFFEVMAMKT